MFKSFKYFSYLFPTWAARRCLSIFLKPKKYQRPTAEEAWYQQARKQKLNNNLAINEWGVDGNPKVLLVHGWEGRGSQLGAFAEPLVQLGFHVIALDGPAHGESPEEETNAGAYARAMLTTQQELGTIEVIIGHSFGGGCSVLACSFGMKVNRLITISSPSNYAQVVRHFLNEAHLSPRAEKAFYHILALKASVRLEDIDIANLGQKLNIPILIIHDKTDKEVRYQNALSLHQAWPHSQLMTTEGLGHRRILKNNEVIDRVVQFMTSKKDLT